MDTLTQQQAIKRLLTDYASHASSDEVEAQLVFDEERHHYQLVYIGWENKRHTYGCVLHFDIKDGKVWIQHNGTEVDVAAELVRLGVPKHNIVIGFHSPLQRQLTEYAVS